MRFAFLKAQVFEAAQKAKEAVDRFVEFCRRLGGTAMVEEDRRFYKASCIFPHPKPLDATLSNTAGLRLALPEIKGEFFRVKPEPRLRSMSITAYAYSPEERIANAGVDLNIGAAEVVQEGGGGVAGKFTRVRLDVSKDYREVDLWLGK